MYAFLNPETGKVVIYEDFAQAAFQALLVGQHFLCDFAGDDSPCTPCIINLSIEGTDDDEA